MDQIYKNTNIINNKYFNINIINTNYIYKLNIINENESHYIY